MACHKLKVWQIQTKLPFRITSRSSIVKTTPPISSTRMELVNSTCLSKVKVHRVILALTPNSSSIVAIRMMVASISAGMALSRKRPKIYTYQVDQLISDKAISRTWTSSLLSKQKSTRRHVMIQISLWILRTQHCRTPWPRQLLSNSRSSLRMEIGHQRLRHRA